MFASLYRAIAYLSRPYIHAELPGWGYLFSTFVHGVDNTDLKWRGAPTRQTRNKRTGQLIELDLSDDVERGIYFLGRYYDIDIQMLLDEILAEGDTCIDVGANIGNFSLYAAYRVGKTGKVIAFEPQRECCAKLTQQLHRNQIGNVEVHNVGLGNKPETLTLHVLGGGSIMAAFAIDRETDTTVRETYEVPVVRGDDVLPADLGGNVLLKIDVEGFEVFALQGLSQTIDTWRPAILLEVERHYLDRAGTSVEALFELLHDKSYSAFDVDVAHQKIGPHRLVLTPIPDVATYDRIEGTPDLIWLPNGDTRIDPASFRN